MATTAGMKALMDRQKALVAKIKSNSTSNSSSSSSSKSTTTSTNKSSSNGSTSKSSKLTNTMETIQEAREKVLNKAGYETVPKSEQSPGGAIIRKSSSPSSTGGGKGPTKEPVVTVPNMSSTNILRGLSEGKNVLQIISENKPAAAPTKPSSVGSSGSSMSGRYPSSGSKDTSTSNKSSAVTNLSRIADTLNLSENSPIRKVLVNRALVIDNKNQTKRLTDLYDNTPSGVPNIPLSNTSFVSNIPGAITNTQDAAILNTAKTAPSNLTNEGKIIWAKYQLGIPTNEQLTQTIEVKQMKDSKGNWVDIAADTYVTAGQYNSGRYRITSRDAPISALHAGVTPTKYVLYKPTGKYEQIQPGWDVSDKRYFGDVKNVYPDKPSQEKVVSIGRKPSNEFFDIGAPDVSLAAQRKYVGDLPSALSNAFSNTKFGKFLKDTNAVGYGDPKTAIKVKEFTDNQIKSLTEIKPTTLEGYDQRINMLNTAANFALDYNSRNTINKEIKNLTSERNSLKEKYEKRYDSYGPDRVAEIIENYNKAKDSGDTNSVLEYTGALKDMFINTWESSRFLNKDDVTTGNAELDKELRKYAAGFQTAKAMDITSDKWDEWAKGGGTLTIGGKEFEPKQMSFNDFIDWTGDYYYTEVGKSLDDVRPNKLSDTTWTNLKNQFTSGEIGYTDFRKNTIMESLKENNPTVPDYVGKAITYDNYIDLLYDYNVGKINDKEFSEKLETKVSDWIKTPGSNYDKETWAEQNYKFVNPDYDSKITEYEKIREQVKNRADKGYGFIDSSSFVTNRQMTQEEAQKWLNENLSVTDYKTKLKKDMEKTGEYELSLSEYKKKVNEPGLYWNVDINKGEITPIMDTKRYEDEEWQELGKKSIFGEGAPKELKIVESIASLALGKSFGSDKPVTPTQLSKAFVVGATQFPQTIYAGIASSFTGGKSWDEWVNKGIYDTGYGISKAAQKGHKTGQWTDYWVGEIGLSPAMTDVVLPLAGGAGISSVGSKIGALATKAGTGAKLAGYGAKIAAVAPRTAAVGRVLGTGALKIVTNPYALNTLFMAPSAAEIGWAKAQLDQGLMTEEEYARRFTGAVRTGFQLGMFSYGASGYKTPLKRSTIRSEYSAIKNSLKPNINIFSPKGKPLLQYGKITTADITTTGISAATPQDIFARLRGAAASKLITEKGLSAQLKTVNQMSDYYLKGFGAKLTSVYGNTQLYAKGMVGKAKVLESLDDLMNQFKKLPIAKVKGKPDFKELFKVNKKLKVLEKEVKSVLNNPTDKISIANLKNTVNEINDLGQAYRFRLESYTTKLKQTPGYENYRDVTTFAQGTPNRMAVSSSAYPSTAKMPVQVNQQGLYGPALGRVDTFNLGSTRLGTTIKPRVARPSLYKTLNKEFVPKPRVKAKLKNTFQTDLNAYAPELKQYITSKMSPKRFGGFSKAPTFAEQQEILAFNKAQKDLLLFEEGTSATKQTTLKRFSLKKVELPDGRVPSQTRIAYKQYKTGLSDVQRIEEGLAKDAKIFTNREAVAIKQGILKRQASIRTSSGTKGRYGTRNQVQYGGKTGPQRLSKPKARTGGTEQTSVGGTRYKTIKQKQAEQIAARKEVALREPKTKPNIAEREYKQVTRFDTDETGKIIRTEQQVKLGRKAIGKKSSRYDIVEGKVVTSKPGDVPTSSHYIEGSQGRLLSMNKPRIEPVLKKPKTARLQKSNKRINLKSKKAEVAKSKTIEMYDDVTAKAPESTTKVEYPSNRGDYARAYGRTGRAGRVQGEQEYISPFWESESPYFKGPSKTTAPKIGGVSKNKGGVTGGLRSGEGGIVTERYGVTGEIGERIGERIGDVFGRGGIILTGGRVKTETETAVRTETDVLSKKDTVKDMLPIMLPATDYRTDIRTDSRQDMRQDQRLDLYTPQTVDFDYDYGYKIPPPGQPKPPRPDDYEFKLPELPEEPKKKLDERKRLYKKRLTGYKEYKYEVPKIWEQHKVGKAQFFDPRKPRSFKNK
jgi:hypothetical protein